MFVNNIRQEPDVAYFIKDDANGLPKILEFSEAWVVMKFISFIKV